MKYYSPAIVSFLNALDPPNYARVMKVFLLLYKYGNAVGLPHSRPLGQGLFELRTRGQVDVRLFYAFRQGEVLILHGFIKKTLRIPVNELLLAKARLRAFDAL